jgi:type I restriction enzyme, S subunit
MNKQSYSLKISDYDNPKIKERLMKNTTYGEIPSEWGISLLKDVSIKKGGVQTGPFGSQLHQKDYKQVGTPIITVEHLGENRIIHENLPLVSDEDLDRLNRYTLKEGDIVFSRVGSVDRRAFVKKKEEGWLFSGRCLRVRPDPKIVDPSYLSWFFGHPNFIDYIRENSSWSNDAFSEYEFA